MEEFVNLYEPRMEQFLQALERIEAESDSKKMPLGVPRLSKRMRNSWESKRFWFNYAARKGFDIDALYWGALHDEDNSDADLLDDDIRTQMEPFGEMKMEDLKAYKEDYAAYLSRRDGE
jgi:hypothetical protein